MPHRERYHTLARSFRSNSCIIPSETAYYKLRNEEMRAENEYNQLHDKRDERIALSERTAQLRDCEMKPFDVKHELGHSDLPALPCELDKLSVAATQNTSIPPVAASALLLSGISAATYGKIELKVDDDWKEASSIWTLGIAESGAGKTTFCNTMTEPFRHIREESLVNYNSNDKANKEKRKLITSAYQSQKMELLKHAINKGTALCQKDIASVTQEIKELEAREDEWISAFPDKSYSLAMIDNPTPNMLARSLSRNGGAAYIASAEGEILLRFVEYAKKDLSTFMKAYDQEMCNFQDGKTLLQLIRPFLEMGILAQPVKALKFYTNPILNSTGMCSRTLPFIAVKPANDDYNKSSPSRWGGIEPSMHIQKYREKIFALHGRYSSSSIAQRSLQVSLDREAYSRLMEFSNCIKETHIPKANENMLLFWGRAVGKAVRLAFAIHAWVNEIPHESMITLSEMEAAIKLLEISMRHANFLLDERGYTAFRNAGKIVQSLFEISSDAESKIYWDGLDSRTMQIRTGLNKEQANNALAVLDRHNYLIVYDNGSPNLKFVLHPDFYDERRNPLFSGENRLAITG